MRIRRATVEDAEVLAELRTAMQRELREGKAETPEAWGEENRAYFQRAIPEGAFVAFVVEAEGRIVATSGMVMYEAPPTPGNPSGVEGYIMNMYTLPSWRGKGLATALVDELREHAREGRARRVWLRASDQGKPIYARAGFVENPHYMQRKP